MITPEQEKKHKGDKEHKPVKVEAPSYFMPAPKGTFKDDNIKKNTTGGD